MIKVGVMKSHIDVYDSSKRRSLESGVDTINSIISDMSHHQPLQHAPTYLADSGHAYHKNSNASIVNNVFRGKSGFNITKQKSRYQPRKTFSVMNNPA